MELRLKHQARMASSRTSTSFTTTLGIRSSRLPLRVPISIEGLSRELKLEHSLTDVLEAWDGPSQARLAFVCGC